MSFCSFFVAVFLMVATEKMYPKYVRAVSTGFAVALLLKPFSNICLQYPVLLFVKTGRANQRRGVRRTFLELRAAKYLSEHPGYADFNHELRAEELALTKNPIAAKLMATLEEELLKSPSKEAPQVHKFRMGAVNVMEIGEVIIDTDDVANEDFRDFRPKYFYDFKCDIHPAGCCQSETFTTIEETGRPSVPECGEIVQYKVPHQTQHL
jgi:hypothetical protein